MAWLELTRGQQTQIDSRDLDLTLRYTWIANPHLAGGYYALAAARTPDGRRTTVELHRVLMGNPPRSVEVDHLNHDTLDNRRENLRLVTHAQNMQNRLGATRTGRSGVRGVSEHHVRNRQGELAQVYWRAYLSVLGKTKASKYFPFTDEGKLLAAAWVEAKRAELMTHSQQRKGNQPMTSAWIATSAVFETPDPQPPQPPQPPVPDPDPEPEPEPEPEPIPGA